MIRTQPLSAAALGAPTLALSFAFVVGASLLLTVSSKVTVPFFPVPMTMQTLAVLGVGFALGSRLGFAAVAAWLAQGAAGLPVFAGPIAGLSYFAGPTGGYLAGFAVAAWATGMLAERGWDRSFMSAAGAALVGLAAVYGLGLAWLGVVLGSTARAFEFGLVPFLPGEALKLGLLACVLPLVWRSLGRREG